VQSYTIDKILEYEGAAVTMMLAVPKARPKNNGHQPKCSRLPLTSLTKKQNIILIAAISSVWFMEECNLPLHFVSHASWTVYFPGIEMNKCMLFCFLF
jgi:hypothetical protein